eukprot:403374136
MRVELQRMRTRALVKLVPFLRTLDAGFFMRVAVFSVFMYYAFQALIVTSEKAVKLKEPPRNSANRFSKTFDQEKQLNSIMEQIKLEEEQENLLKQQESDANKTVTPVM